MLSGGVAEAGPAGGGAAGRRGSVLGGLIAVGRLAGGYAWWRPDCDLAGGWWLVRKCACRADHGRPSSARSAARCRCGDPSPAVLVIGCPRWPLRSARPLAGPANDPALGLSDLGRFRTPVSVLRPRPGLGPGLDTSRLGTDLVPALRPRPARPSARGPSPGVPAPALRHGLAPAWGPGLPARPAAPGLPARPAEPGSAWPRGGARIERAPMQNLTVGLGRSRSSVG